MITICKHSDPKEKPSFLKHPDLNSLLLEAENQGNFIHENAGINSSVHT